MNEGSKIIMTLVQSTGEYLNGCLQPQHFYVAIEISDPEDKTLCRIGLSYEQAAKMLMYNGKVDCTLLRYRNFEGKLISEKVLPPETVHERMKKRLNDTDETLKKRMLDMKKDLYDMINGNKKVGKNSLKDLLQQIDIIESHYGSNRDYVLQKSEEELGAMQDNLSGQLGLFLQAHGIEGIKESLNKLLPTGVPALTDKRIDPVKDDYELKSRSEKAVEDMTSMEVADHISMLLSSFEKIEANKLFHASALESKGKVSIRYMSFQSHSLLDLDVAKRYLKFLKTTDKFKSHYGFDSK